jgi:hypothetical protein
VNAKGLARHLAVQREQLEAANADYEGWAADTSSRREAAGTASAELERRELAQQTAGQRQAGPQDEPQTMVEWWRQLEVDRHEAVERARALGLLAPAPRGPGAAAAP